MKRKNTRHTQNPRITDVIPQENQDTEFSNQDDHKIAVQQEKTRKTTMSYKKNPLGNVARLPSDEEEDENEDEKETKQVLKSKLLMKMLLATWYNLMLTKCHPRCIEKIPTTFPQVKWKI